MPTNNPQSHTPSMQSSKTGTEQSGSFEGRVERGAERVERGAEQLASRAEQIATTAVDRVRDAREQAESGILHQRDMVATRIRRLGSILRSGSESVGGDDPLAKELLDLGSEQIERVADYIGDITPSRIGDDLQSLARRRPGVFFGGAFLLGLTLGRFVRSTGGAPSQNEDELELELEDEQFDADRFRRPYPGRPMTSTSSRDDAAPGTGAGGSSMSGSSTVSRPYPSNPSPSSTVQRSESRPVTGPMSSGGMPPPAFGGAAAPGGSPPGLGSSSNIGGGSPVETTPGHGAKS